MANSSEPDDGESLKRLGGGRWETRDGRFTIEPASGTWSVVDAEETDDLGLPLVRGPFRSLTEAKVAIASARATAAPASPLARRLRDEPGDVPADATPKAEGRPKAAAAGAAEAPGPHKVTRGRSRSGDVEPAEPPTSASNRRAEPSGSGSRGARRQSARDRKAASVDEVEEPGWLRDLGASERGRARRLMERLRELGIPDADSVVRRDLVGDVPAVAAAAIERRLAALPDDVAVADVVDLLVGGRDEELGVRWRLVDGDGREILVDVRSLRRRR